MSSARPFIGISLKMYLDFHQTLDWCGQIADLGRSHAAVSSGAVELAVLPTFPAIREAAALLAETPIGVGAQNLFWHDDGAFTGEVSGRAVRQAGATFVEVGHAERRRLFGETDEIVQLKVSAAARNGLTPLLCVGENERMPAADAATHCVGQLKSALSDFALPATGGTHGIPGAHRAPGTPGIPGIPGTPGISAAPTSLRIIVAYEPVWAIGAEQPASASHIAAVCRAITDWLAAQPFLRDASATSQVIYGGSAGPGLLTELGSAVDGLFLGRFGHDPRAVSSILDEAAELARQRA